MGTGKRTQRSSSSSLSLASYELKTSPTMATSRTPDFTFHSISLLLSTKPLSNTLSSHKNNQTTSMKRKKKSRKERFLQSVAAVVVMDAKKTGLQDSLWFGLDRCRTFSKTNLLVPLAWCNKAMKNGDVFLVGYDLVEKFDLVVMLFGDDGKSGCIVEWSTRIMDAGVLAAGLLEMADPSLSSNHFFRQNWMDESEGSKEDIQTTFGTRVVPVFVLSLADVDPNLMMEDESMVWTSNDVVIVLEHQNEKIPLSYVSETHKRHAVPFQAQRHILAGLASVVGGLSAPYEKASHAHERHVVNWLWAAGCHPFGPFSNTSRVSQMLRDVALRNSIYARVDSVLRKIRETSETVQAFAAEYLKTPLDGLEEHLVGMSSLLYDHRLKDAFLNSSDILQSSMFTQQYVDHVLTSERENMKCCKIEYKYPVHSSQTYIYGGILIAGFVVYFKVSQAMFIWLQDMFGQMELGLEVQQHI
ncbi:hypothetical protein KIW84_050218 [Lathyrus oleraceus]|uniref:Uncharacterized protein n=1 Tax=Pisum sativum TaxID=3888 RepID=A0A9D4WJ75_PEA|nr:hypothetical protein KIW84_050218 [Pisum sativum]